MKQLTVILLVFIGSMIFQIPVFSSDVPQYADNPYTIPVPGTTEPYHFGDHFMMYDINGDGARDFLFRYQSSLVAFDHYSTGTELWSFAAAAPSGCSGTTFGVADIDGDGQAEVILLDNFSNIYVLNGLNGTEERCIALSDIDAGLGTNQKAGYIAVVNLRGNGDRDVIVQTIDITPENQGLEYYINRSIIAVNMEESLAGNMKIWKVAQDDNGDDSYYYEGYWGQAHGGLMCADVDGDGLDEVVGGTMIDDDGTVISLSYPESDWVDAIEAAQPTDDFLDHLDAVAVGDYRPLEPGLEWCVCQEDHAGNQESWETVMFNSSGKVWAEETTLFGNDKDREPQNIAVGEFDNTRSYAEIWNRSRFGDEKHSVGEGQHPWVFNNNGSQIAHYDMYTKLPANFSNNNKYGVENIWTIDWDGSGKEYIVGKARALGFGHVGVFDAVSGDAVWTTLSLLTNLQAKTLYVADISGDSREEIVVFDLEDHTIKVFHNTESYTDTRPDKWDDPLYRRLKQNWCYYSPGGYTQREPVKITIRVFLEGPYLSGYEMDTSLKQYGAIPLQSPYIQDPRIVESIPENTVDWVLVQLRKTSDGNTIDSRSCFLKSDGYIITEDTDELNFFVDPGDYYIVVRHRNHLDVMSSSGVTLSTVVSEYDFSTGTGQYTGNDAAVLESGVYGMYAGDMDKDGEVTTTDYTIWYNNARIGTSGYASTDVNLDTQVTTEDYTNWYNNARIGASSIVH